jgi:5'-nucleotidase
VAAEVARLQAQLEQERPERFEVLGRALVELGNEGLTTRDAVIGNWATEVLRRAARTHVFFAMASGFRAGIPPGEITVERLYTALPYENKIVTAEMTGAQIIEWIELSLEKAGSDGFCQQTGLRYLLREGRPDAVQVLGDPARRELGFVPLDPTATYKVGTSDFQAFRARGYRELFERAQNPIETGQDFHEALIAAIREGAIAAARDGRSGGS